MLFNSYEFFALLLVVLAAYQFAPQVLRKPVLLVASYTFYGWFDLRFVGLLALSTIVDFTAARAMRGTEGRRRKLLLAASVVTNLGILGFFKYASFFLAEAESMAGALGVSIDAPYYRVLLPVGISFYTFQTMSYTIDVYRRELEPTDSLLDFSLFVAFFPQLVAGPIVRARKVLPQISAVHLGENRRFARGAELILLGLFQKVVMSDGLGPVTDRLAQPGELSTVEIWLASAAAVIQFVFDFAGYSNIARGLAAFFGVELPVNFRQPLTRSRNLQDFWRRDHITLMTWFRDYVFRPLRRRSDGAVVGYAKIIVVFALSGMWHGAGRIWVLWGVATGFVLIAEIEGSRRWARFVKRRFARTRLTPRWFSRSFGLAWVLVVLAVSVGWVRSPSFGAGEDYLSSMFSYRSGGIGFDSGVLLALAVAAVIAVDQREYRMERASGSDGFTIRRALGASLMIGAIIVFSGAPVRPFVYLQF